jgi:F0F1-type ATP synthase beta subunit
MVRNQCHRIRRGRPLGCVSIDEAAPIADPGADLQAHVERRERADAVLAAVMGLPADLREVVTLYYLRDHSQREIARFLDLPVATINNRLHAARTRLRRRMTAMVTETLGERKLGDAFARRVGEIVKVRGPIIDVRFDPEREPELLEELAVAGGTAGLQVVQRLGGGLSRCIAPDATGLKAGIELLVPENPDVRTEHLSDDALAGIVRAATAAASTRGRIHETGIKVIDLLCPIPVGGSVGLFGGTGIGKGVLLRELVNRLSAAKDGGGFTLFYLVMPSDRAGAARMARVDRDILGATDRVGSIDTYWLLTWRASDPDLAASTDLFDVVLYCSPFEAVRGIWPAIDPLRVRSSALDAAVVGAEHCDVAERVRESLKRARVLTTDPAFLELVALGSRGAGKHEASWIAHRLPELAPEERLLVERARKLELFFSQPFVVAEPYTRRPGATVSLTATISACRDILDGRYDGIPEEAFRFVGDIDEVVAKG